MTIHGVTSYHGLSAFYFRRLLRTIISAGQLHQRYGVILDFGCGHGELKRLLPGHRVVGYDILPHLSDVADWRDVDFDVFVANQVFYALEDRELVNLLKEIKKLKPASYLVIGTSRQSWLNKIGAFLLGRPRAHSAVKLSPTRELEIIQEYCTVEKRVSVMWLADVFVLRFR